MKLRSDYSFRRTSSPLPVRFNRRIPENNTVHAAFFPARRDQGRALVVLPQWNADEHGHLGLARLLNRFGITALADEYGVSRGAQASGTGAGRLPRFEQHRPHHPGFAPIGRGLRACLDWLQQQGYTRLGILGTSLGSCIAFITAAHDSRIAAGMFNHVSMYFSDVIWTGLSTGHIRKGLDGMVTQDQLREYWSVISPAAYLDRLGQRDLKSLLIWARHDSTFLPVYSQQVLEIFRSRNFRTRFSRFRAGITRRASFLSTSSTAW